MNRFCRKCGKGRRKDRFWSCGFFVDKEGKERGSVGGINRVQGGKKSSLNKVHVSSCQWNKARGLSFL